MMSLRFLRAIFEEWGVVQSVPLGDMLSYLSTHDNSSSNSSSSNSSSSNSSSSNSSKSSSSSSSSNSISNSISNSSSSSSSSSVSNNSSNVLEEICTVCGASIIFTLPSKEEGSAVCTSTCKSCGTFFDRCCTTFLTIGFDAMTSGDVLMCTVCSSTGLLYRSDKTHPTDTYTKTDTAAALDTSKKKSRSENTSKKVISEDNNDHSNAEAVDCRKEFDWSWWDRKAPYCPYCSILMLPLV